MKTPLCNRCKLHDSSKRIIVKLDNKLNPQKIYLCENCYYKILKELGDIE